MNITIKRDSWDGTVVTTPFQVPKDLRENLFISGVSGSGKTTLAEEIAKREASNGAEVVYFAFDSFDPIDGVEIIRIRGTAGNIESESEDMTKNGIKKMAEKISQFEKICSKGGDGKKHIIIVDELHYVDRCAKGLIPGVSKEAGKPITAYAQSLSKSDMEKWFFFVLINQNQS